MCRGSWQATHSKKMCFLRFLTKNAVGYLLSRLLPRPGALGSLRSPLLTFTPQPCSVSAGFAPVPKSADRSLPRRVNLG